MQPSPPPWDHKGLLCLHDKSIEQDGLAAEIDLFPSVNWGKEFIVADLHGQLDWIWNCLGDTFERVCEGISREVELGR